MRNKINTTGVNENSSFELLPEGSYNVTIVNVEDGETARGDYMAKVKYSIVDGEYKGRFIYENLVISDNPNSPGYKILGRTKHFLHVIGQPYEGEVEYDTADWLFAELIINIEHTEYNGKPKVSVKSHDFKNDIIEDNIPY